ncbi:MAG: MFS transporter [Thermoguttaceae bacterium]|jgi:MFS family permease
MPRDIVLLFATRAVRLLAYGALSVTLALYLAALGLTERQIGLLLTLTLLGDTAVSLWLTTRADRFGRRRTLVVGALLMVAAGVVFALCDNFLVLLIAATIGVISPSGNEVGPFLSIEQAALSQVVADRNRTAALAWYTLAGSLATATGSLAGGLLVDALRLAAVAPLTSYRVNVAGYALMGVALVAIFSRLSPAAEAARVPSGPGARRFGLARSQGVVLRLSALFALDAFGGGFVIQALAAYWFYVRFDVRPSVLGGIFFAANLLAGLSALLAARLATRFGLVKTMVFTHLPSNVLLVLVPLMPNLPLAIAVLLLRFSISQMDVPTRQSYVMAVVPADERSAAAGITGVARTTGAALAPLVAGVLLAHAATLDLIFYLAGGLKIVYDLLLYRGFLKIRPPEETSFPLQKRP